MVAVLDHLLVCSSVSQIHATFLAIEIIFSWIHSQRQSVFRLRCLHCVFMESMKDNEWHINYYFFSVEGHQIRQNGNGIVHCWCISPLRPLVLLKPVSVCWLMARNKIIELVAFFAEYWLDILSCKVNCHQPVYNYARMAMHINVVVVYRAILFFVFKVH